MSIETWTILRELGFSPSAKVISDESPGLLYDFGNLELSAGTMLGMRFHPVVSFSGCLRTPREISEVAFELPLQLDSREQCAAFLTYYLDKASGGVPFQPARTVSWLAEGRANQNLLPWAESLAAYEARLRCDVSRVWLRMALNDLAEYLLLVEDEAPVEFNFDGAVFLIRCGGKVIPLAAEGNAWSAAFTISAGNLRGLPKRLFGDRIEISCWEEELTIGEYRFDRTKTSMSNTNASLTLNVPPTILELNSRPLNQAARSMMLRGKLIRDPNPSDKTLAVLELPLMRLMRDDPDCLSMDVVLLADWMSSPFLQRKALELLEKYLGPDELMPGDGPVSDDDLENVAQMISAELRPTTDSDLR